MEFLVEEKANGKIYEISELVTKVSYTDKLNDGCSKLEFSYIDDDLYIENGSLISFKYDNTGIFYGVVFKVGRGKGKEINVTAYDQLRYCKAKDTFSTKGETVTSLASKMCMNFGILKGSLADTKYKLATNTYNDQSWLDILYSAISETLQNTGRKYCIRDEFGSIAIRDIEDLKINLILGDESLVYDYNYSKSIDDDFYNLIKIKDKKSADPIEEKDIKSINKYGLLQHFETANEKMNTSQIKAMAKVLLKLYNQEKESLSLNCLGDTRIRAGTGFMAMIEDIIGRNMMRWFIVKSVTHDFIPIHTMSLEVTL